MDAHLNLFDLILKKNNVALLRTEKLFEEYNLYADSMGYSMCMVVSTEYTVKCGYYRQTTSFIRSLM